MTLYFGSSKINNVRFGSNTIENILLCPNLIQSSITNPDTTEIYNNIGYADGYRWSSSGGTLSAYNNGRVTGWIPYTYGATLYIKNFAMSTTGYVSGAYIILYHEDGIITTSYTGKDAGYNSKTDTYITTFNVATAKYFRISGYVSKDPPVVMVIK